MKKCLIFRDAKSEKFWQIETSEASFITTYGKVGTPGQTTSKEFENAEKCLKEAEKLVSSKLGKGYKETDVTADPAGAKGKEADYLNAWKTIANAKNLTKALIEHFSYLADIAGFESVLEAIFKTASKAESDKENLIISFNQGHTLIASPPANPDNYKKWPVSFQRLISHHKLLTFGKSKDIVLGDSGRFDFDLLDDADTVRQLFLEKSTNVRSPLFTKKPNHTFWLYHPELKNTHGEPALFPCTHELEDEMNPVFNNAGALFLEAVANELYLDVKIPEKVSYIHSNQKDHSTSPWWKSIHNAGPLNGKSIFDIDDNGPLRVPFPNETLNQIEILRVLSISDLTLLPLNHLRNLKQLSIFSYEKVKLQSISGIESLVLLEQFDALSAKLDEIAPLAALKSLKHLNLSHNKIVNIAPLAECKHLEVLYLTDNKIKDISPLSKLDSLEAIFFDRNPVKDLTPLLALKNLKFLGCPDGASKEILAELQMRNPKLEFS
ncbi:WGR domain-containing protein [Leptospira noguchii]|uniref:Leucine rich repeat protein n=1 Tax=Leptospira noguchii TaxID=28182 RepID=M6VL56_9LEPT|nr:WGR domain-containing protein [Leptospira noguchii]EMO53824.1 leucine rich repeat protein [Leptospira noguchii]